MKIRSWCKHWTRSIDKPLRSLYMLMTSDLKHVNSLNWVIIKRAFTRWVRSSVRHIGPTIAPCKRPLTVRRGLAFCCHSVPRIICFSRNWWTRRMERVLHINRHYITSLISRVDSMELIEVASLRFYFCRCCCQRHTSKLVSVGAAPGSRSMNICRTLYFFHFLRSNLSSYCTATSIPCGRRDVDAAVLF